MEIQRRFDEHLPLKLQNVHSREVDPEMSDI
jgi:hypothetical protein